MSQPIPIRASSWAELFDCPARWAAKYLDNKRLPRSAPAQIGTAVHASTAAFDRAALDGSPISPNDAADVLEQQIRCPEEDVDWGDTNINRAMTVGLGVHTRYCTDIAPRQNYVAVEETLKPMEIDMGNGVTILLTGTTDRVYMTPPTIVGGVEVWTKDQTQMGVDDLKTGARACNPVTVKKHRPQLGVYQLLTEHTRGHALSLPSKIISLQTSSEYKVEVTPFNDPKQLLVGSPEKPGLLHFAAKMLKAGLFYGNSSSMLCSEKYCPIYQECYFR